MTKLWKFTLAAAPVLALTHVGMTHAADSGTSLAAPVTTFGKVIQDDVGYGAGTLGTVAVLGGLVRGAHEHTGLLASGLGGIIGGAVCHNYPTWAGSFTMSAGALIHPILHHPMVHAAAHLAIRALG